MTKLQKACLGVLPMSERQVEAIYNNPGEMTAKDTIALCLSHERMRAELWGLQALHEECVNDNPKENTTGNRND